jgi:hypothetical protein
MARPDREKWAAAYQTEYQGFKDRIALAVVKLPEGAKALGTTTRLEYKINNGVLEKYKVRMCVRGDQQREGVDFNASDLYSPVLKAPEARLLAAITAEHGCPILKTDTRQAFLRNASSTEKWEKARCIFDRPTGGQNLSLKVMSCYFSKAFMAPSKPLGHDTCASQNGWRRMVTLP